MCLINGKHVMVSMMKKNEIKNEDKQQKTEKNKMTQEELQNTLQEKYMEYQMIEQQVKQVEEQRQTLEKQIEDLNGIKEAIVNIEKTKVGSELFVPISAGIFIKAEMKQNNELLVNVGDNVVVPKSIKDAIELVEKQEEEVINYKETMENNHRLLILHQQQLEAELVAMTKENK